MAYYGNAVYPTPISSPTNFLSISASTALTQSAYGRTYLITSPANYTITLPSIVASNGDQSFVLINDSASGTTIVNAYGSNSIRYQGTSVSTFSLGPGDVAVMINNGSAWSFGDNSSWKANLGSPAFTGIPTAPTASFGTNTTQLATTAFARQAAGNAQGVQVITANTGLSSSYAGKVLFMNTSASTTLTLPYISASTSGTSFMVVNGPANTVISTSGTDTIYINGATSTSLTIAPYERMTLATDGSTYWYMENYDRRDMSVVGSVRNLSANRSTAGVSLTFSADEIVVGTSLGGQIYKLASYNQSLVLTTTGAGGMDTGSAPTSGYVGIYAIYNPTSGIASILATNATSAAVGNIYSGSNMPTGYTASALISVWPTNSSGNLIIGSQIDRNISFSPVTVLSSNTNQASLTLLPLSAAVPLNAKSVSGYFSPGAASGATSLATTISATSTGVGSFGIYWAGSAGTTTSVGAYFSCDLQISQTLYYSFQATSGTAPAVLIEISRYII